MALENSNYKVYYELGDKKFTSTVLAVNENEAKEKIKDKIKFVKIQNITKNPLDFLKNVFGM